MPDEIAHPQQQRYEPAEHLPSLGLTGIWRQAGNFSALVVLIGFLGALWFEMRTMIQNQRQDILFELRRIDDKIDDQTAARTQQNQEILHELRRRSGSLSTAKPPGQ